MIVYRCPVHGLIESPTWHQDGEDSGYYCPINLSTDTSGITDDVCGKRCEGPLTVEPKCLCGGTGVVQDPDVPEATMGCPGPCGGTGGLPHRYFSRLRDA